MFHVKHKMKGKLEEVKSRKTRVSRETIIKQKVFHVKQRKARRKKCST